MIALVYLIEENPPGTLKIHIGGDERNQSPRETIFANEIGEIFEQLLESAIARGATALPISKAILTEEANRLAKEWYGDCLQKPKSCE